MNILQQTQIKRHFSFGITLFILIVMLAGCGGSGDSGTPATGGTGGTGGSTGSTTQTGIKIGNGTGASFVQGTLNVAVTNLSAGGSTSVTVNLVDSGNNPYATATDVSFSSTCSGLGFATLDALVTTSNGTAVANYVATGCGITDTITATATVEGTIISATGTLTVAPASIGSIEFVSVTPGVIAIAGTGGANLSETATVVFKVIDQSGGPVTNQTVTFALDTSAGGITITPASAVTSSSGTVQTVVSAGTVHTSVKVSATTIDVGTSTTIQTQSDALVVSTGVPDQDSFSLSISTFNPEAWQFNGVNVTVTAYMADHYNNPVPDGTAVAFTVEGGAIEPSCLTANGICSVAWRSQSPRPVTDGRVTILASAIGSESFLDLNGNGVFDDTDQTRGTAFDTTSAAADLAEAYRDDNESGAYDIATEEFLDFNENGSRDADDDMYNGVLCTNTTLCSATTSVHVRSSAVIVMASTFFNGGITINPGTIPNLTAALTSLNVSVVDARGQMPPSGTSVAVSTSNGTIEGTASFTVPNSSAAGPFTRNVQLKSDGTASSGVLTIKVTVPSGYVSEAAFTVNDL